MSARHRVMAVAGAAVFAAASAAAAGVPSVDPNTVNVSRGVATIVVSNGTAADVLGGDVTYDVTLTGSWAVHDWNYVGTLRGESVSSSLIADSGSVNEFSVTSADGTVSGDCGGKRAEDQVFTE